MVEVAYGFDEKSLLVLEWQDTVEFVREDEES